MNTKITRIIEELKELNLLECVSLVKEIEKTFDINTSFSGNNAIVTQSLEKISDEPAEIEKIEEKTSFSVTLIGFPAEKKIAILKIVRNITGLGLKESKEIVDNIPKLIKEVSTKEESENIKNELELAGAKIEIK